MNRWKAYFKLILMDTFDQRLICYVTILLLGLVSMVYIVNHTLTRGMQDTLGNVRNKLGADIVVVSSEYDEDMQASLFQGKPSTFSFSGEEATKRIKDLGLDLSCSSQLFISSLNDSCCSELVQFIVYDPETDWVITPWIKEYEKQTDRRDIIVGSAISYELKDMPVFFDCVFVVAGKLEKSGMGYDECIFIEPEVADSIARFLGIESFRDKASMILIHVNSDENLDQIRDRLNETLKELGLTAYLSSDLYQSVALNLGKIGRAANVFMIIILILCMISLFGLITVITAGKQDQFLLLHQMGVSKGICSFIVFFENGIMALIGSVTGIVSGITVLWLFRGQIEYLLGITIDMTHNAFQIVAECFVLILLITVLSSVYASANVYSRVKK